MSNFWQAVIHWWIFFFFEYIDFWPKILLFRTQHLWNSTTELISIQSKPSRLAFFNHCILPPKLIFGTVIVEKLQHFCYWLFQNYTPLIRCRERPRQLLVCLAFFTRSLEIFFSYQWKQDLHSMKNGKFLFILKRKPNYLKCRKICYFMKKSQISKQKHFSKFK